MPYAIEQAKASFGRWNTAFSARDMEGMVAEMHFPHRRLWETTSSKCGEPRLISALPGVTMRRHPSQRKNGITLLQHPSRRCNQARTKCI